MANSKVPLPGSVRRPVGTRLGDVSKDEVIEISVILKPMTRREVPQSGGAAVSREEFAASYGADPGVIEQVKAFAQQFNLTVTEVSPERRTVKLSGTVADMSSAFGVNLDRYENEGIEYRARTGAVQVPAELAGSIEAVLGLDNRPHVKPHFRRHEALTPRLGAPRAVSYTPLQVAQLYQFPQDVDGTGQTIGLLELGGGYRPDDLQTYFSSLGVKQPTVIPVSVDNAQNAPRGALGYRGGRGSSTGRADRGVLCAQYHERLSGRTHHGDSRRDEQAFGDLHQLGRAGIGLDGSGDDGF
jgi:kumamolisin